MMKALKFIKKELLEMLPPTIFFLVVFHLAALTRSLMAKEYGITIASSAAATIGALVVGKSILIADALPLFNVFRNKKRIYGVAWRVFLYVLIVLFFQVLEELIPLISKHGSVSSALDHMIQEIKWPRFWATHMVFFTFLVVYSCAKTVIDVIGGNKIMDIFFGPNVETGD